MNLLDDEDYTIWRSVGAVDEALRSFPDQRLKNGLLYLPICAHRHIIRDHPSPAPALSPPLVSRLPPPESSEASDPAISTCY